MARAYQAAFEGEPWNERSKCVEEVCGVEFCGDSVGSDCPECGSTLVEAYDADELVNGWRGMILDEDAFMEISLNQDRKVTLATIARPVNREKLLLQKYADNELMAEWIDQNLPESFTWIEDTFANRKIQPRGNLAQRGRTLAQIALRYGGGVIATRTITPQVIGATARDAGNATDLYIGTQSIGLGQTSRFRSFGAVPDWRSTLVIDGKGLL